MKILIIEDEKVLADSLKLMLQAKGFEAEAVYDGESARQVCSDIDREYGISGKSSEEGRRMKACLDAFLQSFESDAPVDPEAEEALMSFIERGGFSIIGD